VIGFEILFWDFIEYAPGQINSVGFSKVLIHLLLDMRRTRDIKRAGFGRERREVYIFVLFYAGIVISIIETSLLPCLERITCSSFGERHSI